MGPGNERGPGNKLGAQRAEQFPHLGNYTLTPDYFLCIKSGIVFSCVCLTKQRLVSSEYALHEYMVNPRSDLDFGNLLTLKS